MTVLTFIIFIFLALICAVLSILFYYHVQRYAFVGDASKRVFLVYILVTSTVFILALVLMILNHIFI